MVKIASILMLNPEFAEGVEALSTITPYVLITYLFHFLSKM
jgi:hypothetical protein